MFPINIEKMVNKRVYNYLIKHSKQYNLNDLKKKLIDSGYDVNVVNEAVNVMRQQTQQRPVQRSNLPKASTQKTSTQVVAVKKPLVEKTVKKSTPVAKTKTQVSPQKQVKQLKQAKPTKEKEIAEPKRGKKWIWIFLIIFFLLIVAGVVYYFFFR